MQPAEKTQSGAREWPIYVMALAPLIILFSLVFFFATKSRTDRIESARDCLSRTGGELVWQTGTLRKTTSHYFLVQPSGWKAISAQCGGKRPAQCLQSNEGFMLRLDRQLGKRIDVGFCGRLAVQVAFEGDTWWLPRNTGQGGRVR